IISFLLVYLCIGRASDEFSVPALLRRRRASGSTIVAASPANAISLRLLQVHLAMAHLMMGWAQLAAPEAAWWSGEGVWLAAMRTDMSLVNLDFLTNHPRVVAAWSHLMTLYLVAFPVFVWVRWTRPLVLAVGVAVWGAFALASGWVLFCLAMLAGLIAFLERPAA
ncbi:MAG TPA: hypothetical protein PJ982_10985, partial [Lacipirellulaceae bacterium]|nr:hypothetical protein [Lacipirellulaceae bacterium]